MPHRRAVLRFGPLLVAAAVSGYLLGGCGGGDLGGLSSLSGATDLPTGSRPGLTGTQPDLTAPTLPPRPETETSPQTTTDSATTAPEPPTTTSEATTTEPEPPPTSEATTTEPEPPPTTTSAPTSEVTTTEASPVETAAVEATSSTTSETPWGWIALAVVVVLGGSVAGLVYWRRRRTDGAG